MPGPRDYLTGTRHALFVLSQGACYYPGCSRQVISWIDDGTPAVDTQIAHIRGAFPGSPRFDPAMDDEERRSFPNLMLLCKPHHDLVDKIRPEAFPVEVLQKWKAEREENSTAALNTLTEDRLEELILRAVQDAGPVRQVVVELGGGFAVGASAGVVPISIWREVLRVNPHVAEEEQVLVTQVRNVGALRASVVSVDIHVGFSAGGDVIPVSMIGRNDYPFLNPRLPRSLESGEEMNWLTSLATIESIRTGVMQQSVNLWTEVRLGSGEQVASGRHPMDQLPSR